MKPREVTHLQTTKALYIPSYKTFSRTTITSSDTTMMATVAGVECSDGKHDYFIPWSMIEVAVFARINAKDIPKAA